jgi:hypothetical protein
MVRHLAASGRHRGEDAGTEQGQSEEFLHSSPFRGPSGERRV